MNVSIMTTRLSKAEKEAFQVLLAKHQKKHPGCKLNERKCNSELSENCIGKGNKELFHKTAATCLECLKVVNHNYYERTKETQKQNKKKTTKV
jgi:hypothetical protein